MQLSRRSFPETFLMQSSPTSEAHWQLAVDVYQRSLSLPLCFIIFSLPAVRLRKGASLGASNIDQRPQVRSDQVGLWHGRSTLIRSRLQETLDRRICACVMRLVKPDTFGMRTQQ